MSSTPPTGPVYSADGYWMWDGTQWLPRPPAAAPALLATPGSQGGMPPGPTAPAAPSGVPAAAAPKKGSCLRRTGCGCLVVLLLLVVVGGGGYAAYTRGLISKRTIANAIGKGTGEVVVTNFSDYEVTMTLTDASGNDFANPGDVFGGGHPIEPNFTDQFVLVPPGTYALAFTYAAPGANVASTPGATPPPAPASPAPGSSRCSLAIRSADIYRFVVINEAIVVVRNQDRPSSAAELNMKTSSLCKA